MIESRKLKRLVAQVVLLAGALLALGAILLATHVVSFSSTSADPGSALHVVAELPRRPTRWSPGPPTSRIRSGYWSRPPDRPRGGLCPSLGCAGSLPGDRVQHRAGHDVQRAGPARRPRRSRRTRLAPGPSRTGCSWSSTRLTARPSRSPTPARTWPGRWAPVLPSRSSTLPKPTRWSWFSKTGTGGSGNSTARQHHNGDQQISERHDQRARGCSGESSSGACVQCHRLCAHGLARHPQDTAPLTSAAPAIWG